MKNCTDKCKEDNKEKAERVSAMMKSMIFETAIYCYKNDLPLPRYTRQQIADYCGCSKDYIKRLHDSALSNIKSVSTKQ